MAFEVARSQRRSSPEERDTAKRPLGETLVILTSMLWPVRRTDVKVSGARDCDGRAIAGGGAGIRAAGGGFGGRVTNTATATATATAPLADNSSAVVLVNVTALAMA